MAKTKGYIGQNYGIYWAKTIGDISGYIGKNYEIYWAKIMGYIMVYILVNNCWIYLSKLWDILVHLYIKLKLRDGLGDYWIYRVKIMGNTKGYIC